jgi:hypothetical protein
MPTLLAQPLAQSVFSTYTINVDLCDYIPEDYIAWGALGSNLVEEFGPAGGNPNVNVYFATEWDALQFLQNYVGLEEQDDLYSYFVN